MSDISLSNSRRRSRSAGCVRSFPVSSVAFKRSCIVWTGDWWPHPLSDTYRIQVSYALGRRPRIAILSPQLKLARGQVSFAARLSRRADGYLRTPARRVDAKQPDCGHDHALDITMAEIL